MAHVNGSALARARRDKERKFGELLEGNRCRVETGADGARSQFHGARARDAPPILYRSAHLAWQRRWMRMLAIKLSQHHWCRRWKTHGVVLRVGPLTWPICSWRLDGLCFFCGPVDIRVRVMSRGRFSKVSFSIFISKKNLVSPNHLPPTSPTMTRALPQHNTGYVLTLSFLAAHRAAPSKKSAPLCVPVEWRDKCRVQTGIFRIMPSEFCRSEMSKSLSITLVHPEASERWHSPPRTLSCPEPLICALLGTGHGKSVENRLQKWEKLAHGHWPKWPLAKENGLNNESPKHFWARMAFDLRFFSKARAAKNKTALA